MLPDEIANAVKAELADPRFADQDHHTLVAYNSGCRGPLCRKRMRDYGREAYRKRNNVPVTELHKPTKLTQWDHLLEALPRRLEKV